MKKLHILIVLIISILSTQSKISAQAENVIEVCKQYIKPPYVSDGQQYKALLNGDEIAEFRITFYGGSTYRIACCSGSSEGNLVFRVYDKERNELFSNRDYNNAAFWDFKFTSTIDCIIETELDLQTSPTTSGFAILLVGFKPTQN